jgi:hypothetical protein
MALSVPLGVEAGELCVDLYGIKGNRVQARYWLTLERADFQVRDSFDLAFRPHEANILHHVPGETIQLYDTAARGPSPLPPGRDLQDVLVKYDVRSLSYKSLLRYSLRFLLGRVKAKLLRKE